MSSEEPWAYDELMEKRFDERKSYFKHNALSKSYQDATIIAINDLAITIMSLIDNIKELTLSYQELWNKKEAKENE